MGILIFDDQTHPDFYISALKGLGKIHIVSSWAQARNLTDIQVILCEVFLERESGFDLMRNFKKSFPNAQVLFISEETFEENIIHGHNMGACDYLVRPISPKILHAKIAQKLRLGQQKIYFENMIFYPKDHFIEIDQKQIALTPIENEILKYFLEHPNQTIRRDDLQNFLWPNTKVQNQNIDTHISNLRKKMSSASGKIKTIKYVGYRLEHALI